MSWAVNDRKLAAPTTTAMNSTKLAISFPPMGELSSWFRSSRIGWRKRHADRIGIAPYRSTGKARIPVPGQTKIERFWDLMGLFKRELGAACRNVDQGADHQRPAIAGIEPSPMAHFLSRLASHRESHN